MNYTYTLSDLVAEPGVARRVFTFLLWKLIASHIVAFVSVDSLMRTKFSH